MSARPPTLGTGAHPPSRRGGRPTLADVIAGVTVATLLIPQSLAYAELAGLPGPHGLYAATLPLIVASLLASSPVLQTGPVVVAALLTLGALLPLAQTGTAEYIGLAALLALMVGVFRLLIGLTRSGWISFLMSEPLVRGFVSASGLLIIASQLPGVVGMEGEQGGVVRAALRVSAHPGEWRAWPVGMASLTLLLTLGLPRIDRRIPGVLLATVAGILISTFFGYEGAVVGHIPRALPPLDLDLPWGRAGDLLLPALVIAIIGFADVSAICRIFAARTRGRWSPNREWVSQGAANVVAGLTGGFPVGGSFTRTSLNHLAGARTRWAGTVTGVATLAFLPFAAVLAPLPRAVLGAIVIGSVVTLIEPRLLVRLARISKGQGLVAWSTFLATLVLAPRVDRAVVLGMGLSLLVHVWRELRLDTRAWTENGTLHLAPSGVLWFASAPQLENVLLEQLAETSSLQRVVLHLGGLGRIDMTGALVLQRAIVEAEAAGLYVELADVPVHARRTVDQVVRPTRRPSASGVAPSSIDPR